MAHLHKKMKKGRPYYYVREMARVDGKPKVVNQVYLGSADRILEMATGGGTAFSRIQTQEFGALWLADLMDREVGLADIVDSVVQKGKRESGPSIGEYFLYAVFNRMIDPRSKRALESWFKETAVQTIRPVDVGELTSQRFWEKWDRVTADQIEEIAARFFRKVQQIEPADSDCFLFDTTNYYTFMSSDTPSELAQRGKNKDGRDWLRQVGVALLVSRDTQMPLFYKPYEGNRHDSKVFHRTLEEVRACMRSTKKEAAHLTLVFDKGMNSEANIALIDAHEDLHFVTTYSTYFAEDLAQVDLSRFEPVDTVKNQELKTLGREEDILTAWRTTGELWGRLRTLVVTHNPRTAAKQRYSFEEKMLRLQEELYAMRVKVREQAPHWKNPKQVRQRYIDRCKELHLPGNLYDLTFETDQGGTRMGFRKNFYRIGRYINRFGKNIIVTDNMDWTTDEIVRASLDRYMVENAFRQTKDHKQVSLFPIRHWTDGKIRCHILTCLVALTYLRMIEIRLRRAELDLTAAAAMEQMENLHSCLCWNPKKRKPHRMIEEPNDIQAQIVAAFGFQVIEGGVLQPL
jgi:transposase